MRPEATTWVHFGWLALRFNKINIFIFCAAASIAVQVWKCLENYILDLDKLFEAQRL